MTNDMDLLSRYNILIDTLIMVCPDVERISEEELMDYIAELEGDYYTFFDFENLIDLRNGHFINDLQVEQIVCLKKIINAIPPSLWNTNEFNRNIVWKQPREIADNLLNSLNISKRKL